MQQFPFAPSQLVQEHGAEQLRRELLTFNSADIASMMSALSATERAVVFRALPAGPAADVFAELSSSEQRQLLLELSQEETRQLLQSLEPDERTALLGELPGQVTQKLLNLLGPDELEQVRTLLGYPADSVGRLMTPQYVAVRPDWSRDEALEHVRVRGRSVEHISDIYVTDEAWKLLDAFPLSHLVRADHEAKVSQLMDDRLVSIGAQADREDAVRLMQRYDLASLPVTDRHGVLLGVVTVDDILDIAEQEATEDIQQLGGMQPLSADTRSVGGFELYRKRIGWLVLLIGINMISGGIIGQYEDLISEIVVLVTFLPLIIDSAGNAGSQASTLMVRALATREVTAGDWLRVLGREVLVAGGLGLTLGLVVSALGLLRGGPEVALVVALTMSLVVVMGSLVGSLLPFALQRMRLDPATASAPLVTSLADMVGVAVYFAIATWLLSGML